jgi:hypothetical protein
MNGNSIRAYGEETGDICKKVLGMAENLGLKVESVKSITPTLEDAFLELTGLSPVVMAMEKEGRKKLKDSLRCIFYIILKDMRTYYLKPPASVGESSSPSFRHSPSIFATPKGLFSSFPG